MKRALIVTADAARARICLYQEQAKPGFELTEYRDLNNPGRRLKPSEMVSDRSSLARAGGPPKDDHRFDKIEDMDEKFAKFVVETIQQVLKDKQMAHLILIAPPKMLGILRAVDGLDRPELKLDEIPSDLSKASLPQLHDALAAQDLIPPRARLAAAR
jgi:protein required for attachment to host cells